jgi:hypothetical protein
MNAETERLKLITLLVVTVSVLFPVAVLAWNEPNSFMGIKFWRPISDSLAECPFRYPLSEIRGQVREEVKQSRGSIEKMLAIHEEEKKKLEEEYDRRKELFRQNRISRAELSQTERALAGAILRVDEDKRWLAETDATVASPVPTESKSYDDAKTWEMKTPCWQEYSSEKGSYSIKNLAIGGFFLDVTANSLEGKIAHLSIIFHDADYPKILLTFRERYGAPTSTKKEPWRSKIGATFTNEINKWEGRRLTITLEKLGYSVDRGFIDYDTDIWKTHSARKFEKEIKDAAKGL